MSEILRFVIVDSDNNEGDHEYADRDEAIRDAGKQGAAVIMRTYIYDDSELVWTPNGDDVWPPCRCRRCHELARALFQTCEKG